MKQNIFKKICALFIAASIMASIPVFVSAGSYEAESNDTFATANAISVNNAITGNIKDYYDDDDYYKFPTTANGYITINFTHEYIDSSSSWDLYLYKYDGETNYEVYKFFPRGDGSNPKSAKIGLPAGTYYIAVSSGFEGVDYNLTVNFISSDLWETEFNDTLNTANNIMVNRAVSGNIKDYYDDDDYYKFSTTANGYITINFTHEYIDSGSIWGLYLYKYDGETNYEVYKFFPTGNNKNSNSAKIYISAGIYYIAVLSGFEGIDYKLTVQTPVVPSTPKSPKAVAANYNSIKVNWSAVPGATGYVVYRYNASKNIYQGIKVTSATSFTDTYLQTGKTYYYKIKAYKNFSGTNSYSVSSATVSATPSLSTPGAFKAARASSTSIKISWSAVPGATGYVVYRYFSSTKGYQKIKVTTATSYINTGLKTGVNYFYKVRAYRSVGDKNVYGNLTNKIWAKTY